MRFHSESMRPQFSSRNNVGMSKSLNYGLNGQETARIQPFHF
jgi:hypothetical protein